RSDQFIPYLEQVKNKDSLLLLVAAFLNRHLKPKGPLLLGFSGGGDSLALLHLLLECRRFIPFDLHLAHIDHGWRQESEEQAAFLGQYAQKLALPFHLHTLKKKLSLKNREAEAREERLKF